MLAGLCIYAMLQKWDLVIMPICQPAFLLCQDSALAGLQESSYRETPRGQVLRDLRAAR